MSILKHEGKWQVRIRKKGYPQQTRSFLYKADAEAWEREILAEIDRGIFVSRSAAERTTLRELLQRYLDENVCRLANAKREGNRVKALMKRSIAQKFAASVQSTDVAAFIREREAEGVSGNTIRLDVAIISRVFNLARSSWGLASLSNPTEKVEKPKISRGRERRLEKSEESAILAAASDKLALCIRFALETAMRREEISTLRWENVNLEKRSVLLEKTKNGDKRTVPLSPAAIEILKSIAHTNETVFSMSADAITQAFEAARKKANISDLHFHDLRHEATSRLFENTDLDIMEIRSITGHRSLQMLARYSHLRTDRLADRLAGKKR